MNQSKEIDKSLKIVNSITLFILTKTNSVC